MDYNIIKEKMNKSIDNLREKFAEVRAGRANPAILNKIRVDYYGTPTPINQVAGVSVPEARLIVIQPWDVSILKEIEKAILASDIGINPNNDGKVIRLAFPELTEERRKELVKDIKKMAEEANNDDLDEESGSMLESIEMGSGCVADMTKSSIVTPAQKELQLNDILNSKMLDKTKELFDIKKITVKSRS